MSSNRAMTGERRPGGSWQIGLFGKLFAFLLAFKKALIAGVVAAGGVIAKLFKKKDTAA